MATYDYSKLSLSELIQKIGNSRYWNLPKMLEEALKRLNVNSTPKYKIYAASLTQTGTNAPVATVLENTLGGDIVWNYEDLGRYIGTLPIEQTKSSVFIGFTDNTVNFEATMINSNTVQVATYNDGGTADDDSLNNTSIEIKIYS